MMAMAREMLNLRQPRLPGLRIDVARAREFQALRSKMRDQVIDRQFLELHADVSGKLQALLGQIEVGAEGRRSAVREAEKILQLAYRRAAELGKQKALGDRRQRLSGADRQAVNRELLDERRFLQKFADAILEDGGRMPYDQRMQMYADALRGTMNRSFAAHAEEGAESYWALNAAEHCVDCIAENERGWVVRGVNDRHPGDGGTVCLSNCHCDEIYADGRSGAPILPARGSSELAAAA